VIDREHIGVASERPEAGAAAFRIAIDRRAFAQFAVDADGMAAGERLGIQKIDQSDLSRSCAASRDEPSANDAPTISTRRPGFRK
jgi:hypothetical protein